MVRGAGQNVSRWVGGLSAGRAPARLGRHSPWSVGPYLATNRNAANLEVHATGADFRPLLLSRPQQVLRTMISVHLVPPR